MSYFSDRARELGVDSPKAGEKKKGESYFQQRARELGVSATPQSSESTSDYFTQRQMELGIIPNTRQEPVGYKPTNNSLNSFLDKQSQAAMDKSTSTSQSEKNKGTIPSKFLDPASQLKSDGKLTLSLPEAKSTPIPGTMFNQDLTPITGITGTKVKSATEAWLMKQQRERMINREENPNLLSKIDKFMEPSNQLVDKLQANIPGVAAFQRGAGASLGVNMDSVAPVTGSKLVNVPASIVGSIASLATVPGPNQLTAPFKVGQAAAGSKLAQVVTRGNRYGSKAVEGAVGGGIQGGAASLIQGKSDANEVGKSALYGAAIGGVGDPALYGLGKGVGAIVNRMKKNNVTEEAIQEMFALPAPRQRGNANTAQTSDVITPEYTFGLPAPNVKDPTTGRISQRINPYREQFENLMRTSQKFQDEGLFTPGRESEELESLWSQMAGREGVSLDELIQRAYPSRQSKISPDLVQNARNNQYSREVAGAPMPVQTLGERLPQQGQINPVASPITVPARSSQVEVPTQRIQQTQRITSARSSEPTITSTSWKLDTPQQGSRSFINTMNQGELTPEVRTGLNKLDRDYDIKTNDATVNNANKRIERRGIDKVEAELLNKKRYTAEDVATGMRMIQELQTTGNVERAVTIAEKLTKELTNAGQTVQAASIWNRLSPEGALIAAQRKVNSVNERLLRGQAATKISDEQAINIQQTASAIQAAGVSQERAGVVSEILERIRKGEVASVEERQTLANFVEDAKRFLKKGDSNQPKQAKAPKEMRDKRIRDRVISTLENQEQAAMERIRARRGRMNSLPLDEWADYAYVGALKLAKEVVKFADFSDQMIRDLGDDVRPYLRQIYEKAQETLNSSSKKVTEQTVSRAERAAESFLKSKEATLSPDDTTLIRNMAQGVSKLSGIEQRIASQDLQAIMNGFERAGVGRKLASAQYVAMLLNPVTQVRNIVGNELMYRAERIVRIIGTPIDIAASKVTGGGRTITFKSGPTIWEDFFKPSADYWSNLGEGMKAGWRGVNPDGLTSKYEIRGQAFKSKYNPMTYMEKALGATLQGFDYAAYTRATNQRMQEMGYLDAINSGIKGRDAIRQHIQNYMTKIDDAAHTIAKDYGKFATLQDDSKFAGLMTGFRRGANKLTGSKDFGVGNIILPFAKTPSNLMLRGLDYSPVGIIKALKQTSDILTKQKGNTDLTRADVINSVSRALFGTGMGAVAYWLADKGAIFGQSNKDAEVRKLMQGTGVKDFQINGTAIQRMLNTIGSGGDIDEAAKLQSGDTLWTYNWAQPISMPMAIGSNVYQSVKGGQGALQTIGEGALSGASTLLDSSLLSGIREAMQIPVGEANAFKAVALNLIKQVPGQYVASLMRQFNTVFDDTVKETYSPNEMDKILNPAKSNIPILAQKMPQRVDTLGRPQTKPSTIFDVFITPAARSKYKPTPEAQLVIDLINETGDNSLAPRAVEKNISGKSLVTGLNVKVKLTTEQYVELQRIVGQETAERIKKIDPKLPTDKKVELVLEALTESGKIGKNKIKKDLGMKLTN